jgi:hypothetical protein
MESKNYAVITGDIIGSTKLSRPEKDKLDILLHEIFMFFEKDKRMWGLEKPFEIFRGDSFQAVFNKPPLALNISLIIRSFLRMQETGKDSTNIFDARIAAGIGKIEVISETVGKSNGEAFHLSGRIIDTMKLGGFSIQLRTPWENVNNEFDVHCFVLSKIIDSLTAPQANVVFYKLQNFKEIEISDILKISQPAVNQRSKSSQWDVIELITKRFQSVIK